MDNQIEKIMLPNWYQFDVEIKDSKATTISLVIKVIEDLKSQDLLKKWFYLYEFSTIRIRLKSSVNEQELKQKIDDLAKSNKLTFSENNDQKFGSYWEDKSDHPTEEYMETFANVMPLITELNIKKFNKKVVHGNFRLVNMLSHCIFNNTYHGLNTEAYFLLKRLSTSFDVKDDPELTGIDELNDKIIQAFGLHVPIKAEK